mgnify:CR=1 FL=1
MKKDNKFGRVLILLLTTIVICTGLYFMPDTLFGFKLKKLDMLSDLRIKTGLSEIDSLRLQLEHPESIVVDTAAMRDSIMRTTGIDSITLALRDSLYQQMHSNNADSIGTHIEDYSVGHIALKRFFTALSKSQSRPVYVAFMGDSFIEGDILVSDFRDGLQKKFGGRGVGFVPITAITAQFRPTVEARAEGWTTYSILTNHTYPFTLSGMTFEAKGNKAFLHVKMTKRFPELQSVNSLKLFYEQNIETELLFSYNGQKDTLREILPAISTVSEYERKGIFREASLVFNKAKGFRALGVALEDNAGVSVDNFSLRGNSGLVMARLDISHCRALNKVRPYDLIVMQYGLNVVSDSVYHYGWYGKKMVNVIRQIKACFPEADILMLGVSDRSHQIEGKFQTMPAVLALLNTQRQIARETGIAFWNVFDAMGGENSMVRFVQSNWASKDYTHMSFRGGREIANALLRALLSEKKFYDEADEVVN